MEEFIVDMYNEGYADGMAAAEPKIKSCDIITVLNNIKGVETKKVAEIMVAVNKLYEVGTGLKAILTYKIMIDGKEVEETRLFDTEKAKKICGIKNGFGYEATEIYITEKGVVFICHVTDKKITVPDQKDIKRRIGENEPEKYIEFFGEVEEA